MVVEKRQSMLTPKMAREEKERLIRAFAGAIRDIIEYIPGPDIVTDETCMADAIGAACVIFTARMALSAWMPKDIRT